MAQVLPVHENEVWDKRVESVWFPRLDAGSTPASSTKSVLSDECWVMTVSKTIHYHPTFVTHQLSSIMRKQRFNKQQRLIFKHFTNKGYALFSCLGKEVMIGVLSVSTLTHANANDISTQTELADDTLNRKELMLDEVVVTGSRTPQTQLQSAAIIRIISREEIDRAAAATINDVLKIATGVDVRQRGGFGVQTDISIGGGTFDQITLLLNGINISNPQTGHNAADFPVSINDIERIEILEGAASRTHGIQAFCGAVNIVTRKSADHPAGGEVTLATGSFATAEARASAFLSTAATRHQGSVALARSDGATRHSDFEKYQAFYSGQYILKSGNIEWQTGISKKNYGANTFYSAKFDNQYERTEHGIVSLKGYFNNLLPNLSIRPSLYHNYFTDHYQLMRGITGDANGENFHRLYVAGTATDLSLKWKGGTTTIGLDIHHDHILSTAYGNLLEENKWKKIHGSDRHYSREASRTNTSFYAEHSLIAGGLSVSAGVLANRNTGLDSQFRLYPGIDASFRPDNHWKIFAAWNMALRMPTYTDIYISNAVQQGDRELRPERNNTTKLGIHYQQQHIFLLGTIFYSHGRDMIDWVYENQESTRYHAQNIGRLNNMGFSLEASGSLLLTTRHSSSITYKVGYAFIHQHHETQKQIVKSLYALEYLRHKLTAQVEHPIWSHLSALWAIWWQQRMNGYHPYTKIDAKLSWTVPRYRLYLQADNLTAHRYYDVGGIRQPGLWLMAGCVVNLSFHHHAQ